MVCGRLGQRAGVALVARGLGLVGHAGFGVGVGVDGGVLNLDGRQLLAASCARAWAGIIIIADRPTATPSPALAAWLLET